MRRRFAAFVSAALAGALIAGGALAQSPRPGLFAAQPLDFERAPEARVVGAYVPNWEPVALVDGIRSGSLSHILYAFLRICGPGQLEKDAANCAGKQDFQLGVGPREAEFDAAFQRLKKRAPHIRVLASVGGWGGSDPFFHLANDPARRAVFTASVVAFLRAHPGFDGIDIDWEHPGGNGAANGVQLGAPADGQGYADLIDDLRQAVDAMGTETGRRYLVTTAVNTTSTIVKRVNFRQAGPALDLVFMMSYDFYGAWSEAAGNHTMLFSSSADADDSLDRSVRNMLEAGVPAAKLVAGVAMYGRGFAGVAKPVTGAAKSGPYPAGGEGTLRYREIAAEALGPKGSGIKGFKAVFDAKTQAWSLWNAQSRAYIGYDDPRAVLAKGRYVLKHGLAGIFAWELSQDNGDLLNAMNLGVGNKALAAAAR
ncbi:glycoside hydrolase family 18 protein [Roseateles violae]|uniref:chitinase n=1 Tax=Roseateles violae TaxID=3058042 RepID=A0ABT8DMS1_9BURK|nr:glycoside hydrolase family 18 protein [Pelomonas sp. PFR6]MDN3919675.1 glycoside hydrolase family 18 protein [Pelomonas sp. PFR6]